MEFQRTGSYSTNNQEQLSSPGQKPLKMKTAGSSETSVFVYRIIWRHITEGYSEY
jgi:hypothetical protein